VHAPNLAGSHAILLAKRRVEPAKTLEAAPVGNLNHRIVGVGKQTPGVYKSVRLRERARRDAEYAFDRAPQLAIADAEFGRQRLHAFSVEGAGGDPSSGRAPKTDDSIDGGTPGDELRPATQTRPESGLLCFGR
jgi:hypothetical protein